MEGKNFYEYGKEENTKCKHDISWIKTCRDCIFSALCMLEEKKVIAKTQKNIF